jgi:hypothetical protein
MHKDILDQLSPWTSDERQVAGQRLTAQGLKRISCFTFLEPSRALADKNIRSIVQGLFLAHREAFLSQPGKLPVEACARFRCRL